MNDVEKMMKVHELIEEKEKEIGRGLFHGERAEIFRQVFGWEFKPGDGYGSKEAPLHSY